MFRPTTTTTGLLLAGLMVTATACSGTDGEESQCTGRELLPHRSPVNLGEFYPPKSDQMNPGDPERVPIEWTLLLESTCQKNITVEKACLVGEGEESGDRETDHFTLEGPQPESFGGETQGALRLTYDRQNPNGGDDLDNVSLIVQSNAQNFPTLVVPVCARVVKEGTDKEGVTCESPIEALPKGESKSGLCE
jgi:hypothetical protein